METSQVTKTTTLVPLDIPFPEAVPLRLHIAVGACKLIIKPRESAEGDGRKRQAWISGTYQGPTAALPLKVSQEAGTVKISQGQAWNEMLRLFESVPTLDLALGTAEPYELEIDTGASENYLDLGGLPLTHLLLKQGAGKIGVDFSAPNPVEMDRLFLSSGASGIEMTNLANSGAARVSIEGGAASYRLDFGGTLSREMAVNVSAAMSSVDLVVPASTAARVTYQSVLGSINIGEGFLKKEGVFWTEAAIANLQPVLLIHVSMTMGSLNLRNG